MSYYKILLKKGGVSKLLLITKEKGIEVDTTQYLTACGICHAVLNLVQAS